MQHEAHFAMETKEIIIALGGGGDVITATARASSSCSVVASLSWEKMIVDPFPGPRTANDLTNIQKLGDFSGIVTEYTAFPSGALTTQAQLFKLFPDVPQVILDPWKGVQGLIKGLEDIQREFGVSSLVGIDVGGDLLASAPSPILSSPMIDAMLTSATWNIQKNASIEIYGLGLDGEIDDAEIWSTVNDHLNNGLIEDLMTLSLREVHKLVELIDRGELASEVSSLFCRAHFGMRGTVLMRDGGLRVKVGPESVVGYKYAVDKIVSSVNPLCKLVSDTHSLEEASQKLLTIGYRTELEDQILLADSFPKKNNAELDVRSALHDALIKLRTKSKYSDVDYVSDRYLAKMVNAPVGQVRMVLGQNIEDWNIQLFHPFVRIRPE